MAKLEIALIPALSDNYVYLAHDPASGATAVVDPAEAAPVLAALVQRGWTLTHILNTHHHADHIGGNEELKARFGGPIVGPRADAERIPGIDVEVGDGDTYDFAGHQARVFDTPGHTRGHIAYHFAEAQALACGDTLFSLGCGRLLEGTPAEMFASLRRLAALPDATQILCGHEYTVSNARFALTVEPDNPALRARAAEADAQRAAGRPTVPVTLGAEKAANPFLRAPDVARFAELRAGKDAFR